MNALDKLFRRYKGQIRRLENYVCCGPDVPPGPCETTLDWTYDGQENGGLSVFEIYINDVLVETGVSWVFPDQVVDSGTVILTEGDVVKVRSGNSGAFQIVHLTVDGSVQGSMYDESIASQYLEFEFTVVCGETYTAASTQ